LRFFRTHKASGCYAGTADFAGVSGKIHSIIAFYLQNVHKSFTASDKKREGIGSFALLAGKQIVQ